MRISRIPAPTPTARRDAAARTPPAALAAPVTLALLALAAGAAQAQQPAPRRPAQPQAAAQAPARPAATAPAAQAAAAQPAPAPQPYVEELPGMGRPIDTAATAARRARVMDRLGDAVAIVPANRRPYGEHPQDTDFRQSVTFLWLTGLEQPAAFLVLEAHASGPDTAVLLLPDRNLLLERWTGAKLGPGERAAALTGIPLTLSVTKLDSIVLAAKARGVPVWLPFDRDAQGVPALDWLRADSAAVHTFDLHRVTDSLRVVKDDAELAVMRRAAAINASGHQAALRVLRPGMMEYELEAEVEGTFHRLGADAVSFPSIIGSGFHSTVLHYMSNRKRMDPGELVVVDVGAEVGGYGSDLTRTYPVSGRYTPRQRAIYELVLATQQAAIDSVRPGMTTARLNTLSREYMRAHSGDLCGPESCVRYYIHGLSHHIGLGGESPGAQALAPGMVITVEPGIYIPEESLGVRIEDDVVVTPTGHEVITAGAVKTVADVERALAEGRTAQPAQRPRR